MEAVPSGGHRTEWVLLTSGTTGVPKMVAHSLAGLTGALHSVRSVFDLMPTSGEQAAATDRKILGANQRKSEIGGNRGVLVAALRG